MKFLGNSQEKKKHNLSTIMSTLQIILFNKKMIALRRKQYIVP